MHSGLRAAAAISVLAFMGSAALAGGRNPPLTTPELLVDLARDYGLMQRGHQTQTDVTEVRTLLEAAVRLDPKLADAYAWLYELATLEGDRDAAASALAGLLAADPENQNAFALWLAAGVRAQQTVEKRQEWLEQVASSPRPPAMLAMAHIGLARVAIERLDMRTARDQVRQALELEPGSPEAAALALDVLDPNAPPAERLRAMLRVLALRPLSIGAVWQVGLLLNDYGLPEEAREFYDYGYALRPAGARPETLPGGFLLDLARNRQACGQMDEAIEYARQAVAADPTGNAETGMYLSYLLDRKGRSVEAGKILSQLAQRFAAITDPQASPLNDVAQAAWFYCLLLPDPHRAALLADAAAQRTPHDPFVQRVLGWAQARNHQNDEARQTLAPLARHDPFAAYMLARLMLDAGDEPGARRVVAELEQPPSAGPAHDMLALLENPATASQPASLPIGLEALPTQPASTRPAVSPEAVELRAVLAEFDRRVLKFKDDPSAFLEARIVMDDLSPAPGEPWWATFSLTNRGPFPITLTPDAMVNPVFVLSYTMEGDRTRSYPALTTVSVDRVRVLYPGQSTQVRRTLDVGPPRHVSQQTPQQVQRVEIQALLDAQVGPDGQWHPALGGQQLRSSIYFNRLPASTGREAIAALSSALSGDSDPARVRAIEVIAELLGEQQRAELKRLNYEPGPVPADQLRAALLTLLGDNSWELRVRTLDSLQLVGLDRAMTDAVERCLEHPHWLVRLMAVRVLARQGRPFVDRAQTIAHDDADELVRAMAQCMLTKLTQAPPPTVQPSTRPASPGP
jgi:tetratricopeptide (TPR) repeat protein